MLASDTGRPATLLVVAPSITDLSRVFSQCSLATVSSNLSSPEFNGFDFEVALALLDDNTLFVFVLQDCRHDDGKRMASHFGHNIKSPWESLTDRLLTF